MSYVGRLAPSPSGPMHFGMARTFLAAWLDARACSGTLLLRIEDIDRPRVRPGATEEILRDLEWLGLHWDEGPGKEGSRGPHHQSAREPRYLAALERLMSLGRIYPCTCTRKEVQLASSAPHGPNDEGPRYPGTCRDPAARNQERTPALRLKTFPEDHSSHQDLRYGPMEQNIHEEVGDFIVRRSDGLWAYQLAVAIDDLEQGVTRIVRGADLLSSMPRQILLRRLLDPGAPAIESLHIPLVMGTDGKRLATREGAARIGGRREAGADPETVIGELATSLGLVQRGTRCRADELIAEWRPEKVPLEPIVWRDP